MLIFHYTQYILYFWNILIRGYSWTIKEKDDTGYLDYYRDINKEIEGISWSELETPKRGARHQKGELEMAENIS